MKAMVALEQPDGSVRVIVLDTVSSVRFDQHRHDTGSWYNMPRFALPGPTQNVITVEGYGDVHDYATPPPWFQRPEVDQPKAIEP